MLMWIELHVGLDFSVTSLTLHVTTVHTLPSPSCSHFILELHFIFLELVLSSSLQNQFSKVANNAFIKSDIFASGAISFSFTEKLCYKSFRIMPSKPSNTTFSLMMKIERDSMSPTLKLQLTQLLDFNTISYRTTGVSIHTFYNYSYLKRHMISAPSILYPFKPSQSFSSKSFNPPLLLPSYVVKSDHLINTACVCCEVTPFLALCFL